nr:efflux RND transporter periplasmic adaptor subunit [uncultured Cellulosilyticum sp.]
MSIKESLKSKKILNAVVVIAALVAVLAILHFGFNGNKDTEAMAVSQFFDTKDGFVAQGVLETQEVSVNSKVPGRIKTIFVQEGQEVKAGDPLVEISSDELQAKKQQAEAALKQAEAGLKAAKELYEQAKAGLDASNGLVEQAQAGVTAAAGKVNEAKAGVAASEKQYAAATAVKEKADNGARTQEVIQAQAAYDLMKTSYDRVAALVEKGAVSQQKLDEIKTQLDVAAQTLSMAKEGARAEDKAAATATSEQAAAGVEASKTRVDQAEAGLTAAKAQLTQAMAGVDSSKALLSQAQAGVEAKEGLIEQAKGAIAEVEAYLNEVVIKAPMDGVVTGISSEEGELASTGTQIATVSNLKGTWVEVSIKETDLDKVKQGQKVTVKVPAYKDQTFTGTVTTINAQPDFAIKRATNENGDFDIVSFGVKIEIENADEILRPGMSAYIQFNNEAQ